MKPLRHGSPLLAVKPIREPGFLPWTKYDTSSHRKARDSQPYRVGDVIRWKGQDRTGRPAIRRGLVVLIRAEYQERAGEWLPVFLVRPERIDGGFAAGYLRVWPGEIQRAEEGAGDA